MKITINKLEGLVGIDGVFRAVDLGDLDAAIRVAQFDTERGAGVIEYAEGVTVPAQVRDHAGEDAAWAAARAAKTPESQINVPVMTRVEQVQRQPERVTEWAPLAGIIERYRALDPSPEQLAEQARQAQRAGKLSEIAAIERDQSSLRRLREILIATLPDGRDKESLAAAEAAIADKRRELDAM